jgi:hypothetical protein
MSRAKCVSTPSLRLGRTLAALALLTLPVGCGKGEPGLVPVSGRVTLNGGPWPKEGTITFTPAGAVEGSDRAQSRPGSGKFDIEGSFTVGSFEPADGLFPGRYQVGIECLEAEPGMDDKGRMVGGKSLIPKKFQSGATSGLSFVVKPGERSAVASLDVKTK